MASKRTVKHKTVLFAVTMDADGILSCDQIGTVTLTRAMTLDVNVARSELAIHLDNIVSELRSKLASRGGKVKTVA